ncbi:hypothetical protein P4H94_04540 [Paenibacillus macerans]|uniref:Uncharacterized protein n=1 Tax=Paenibacillus macerans TaxID=44252 RepID=A0A6N8F5G7_PAEMA|nr:hypothetical protein [Paenibacillus macerans]MDU5945489.1 hypothetical protein [Paenibacillus macerans]MEC0136156.1 hypothetical protein [Paenibacillus macerans]MUG26038.1 hypothetical protein [Paenibacillus macerans]
MRETGVQEFARILNLEADEAEQVYDLIKRHQTAVINEAALASELNKFALRYNNPSCIEQLEYIQNHFISSLGEGWKKRIEVLRGGPDDYMECIEKLLEEQRMKDEIARLRKALEEAWGRFKLIKDKRSIISKVSEYCDAATYKIEAVLGEGDKHE